MSKEDRGKFDIDVEVVYRLEDAYYRISNGELDVSGCYVIIDNITNNIRGGRRSIGETPEQVVNKVAMLRELLLAKAAAAVIVCEVKPMTVTDVRPHNGLLHEYLTSCGGDGYGCRTQMKMEFLSSDGFHIDARYDSVRDRTYACALVGLHVPEPATEECFVPSYFRRRWEETWPRLVGNTRAGMFDT